MLKSTKIKTQAEKEWDFLIYAEEVIDQFGRENYGVGLKIPVELSGRLKVKYGYFSVKRYKRDVYSNGKIIPAGTLLTDTMRIVLSKNLMYAKNKEKVESIIKHEALHYILCVLGKPFSDGHEYFERELQKHGLVSMSVDADELGLEMKKYVWVCTECANIVITGGKTRKDYSRTHRSNCCNSKIKDKGWNIIKPGQTKLYA